MIFTFGLITLGKIWILPLIPSCGLNCTFTVLDSNYTRMLRAILNKSWRQHPTKQQLYGHQPLIAKTIKIRRTRHAGHCWRSKDELIRDVPLWIPSHGWAKAGPPVRTYIQQLCADTECSPEDLPEAMDDREGSWISVLMAWYDDCSSKRIALELNNPRRWISHRNQRYILNFKD